MGLGFFLDLGLGRGSSFLGAWLFFVRFFEVVVERGCSLLVGNGNCDSFRAFGVFCVEVGVVEAGGT